MCSLASEQPQAKKNKIKILIQQESFEIVVSPQLSQISIQKSVE